MFLVRLRVSASVVDNSIPMIRRRVKRVELHWDSAGIDDVVIRPGRNEYCEAGSNLRPNSIKNSFTGALLYAKELVELVDFRPNFFFRLQRHQDKLAMLCRIQHSPKFCIFDGEAFDVLRKAFHLDIPFVFFLDDRALFARILHIVRPDQIAPLIWQEPVERQLRRSWGRALCAIEHRFNNLIARARRCLEPSYVQNPYLAAVIANQLASLECAGGLRDAFAPNT